MKFTIVMLFCFLASACTSQLKSEKYASIDASAREFVLLTSTPWDADFRSAMHQQNFKLLKFASQATVIREDKAHDLTEIYSKAGARYAISLSYIEIDRTLVSAKFKMDLSLEVTDVRSNEVVIAIKKRGWTPAIFKEIAQELAEQWKQQP